MTFGRLIAAEVPRLKRDRALMLAAAVLACACALATLVGLQRLSDDVKTAARLAADESARYALLDQALARGGFKAGAYDDWSNPQMVALTTGARAAVLPAPPLSVLAAGQRPLLPTTMSVSTWRKPFDSRYQPLENGWHLAIGTLDFAFIIVTLLPLFIVALGFDVLSGERESGTLALLNAQRPPLGRLVFVRIGLRLAVLVGVIGTLASVAVTLADAPAADVVTAIGVIVVITALYGACWFGLLLLIQRLHRTSLTNAFLALGLWLVVVVVLPPLLQAAAERAEPLPSRIDLLVAARDIEERATDGADGALESFYGEHPQLAQDAALVAQRKYALSHLDTMRAVDDRERVFDDVFSARSRRITRTAYLLPPALAQEILQRLAGTDAARHHEFLRRVRQLNRDYAEYFYGLVLAGQPMTREALRQVPRLAWNDDTAPARLTAVWPGAATLLVLASVLLGVGLWRIGRVRWIEKASA
jgi:ABC-2 type transport system permease protein